MKEKPQALERFNTRLPPDLCRQLKVRAAEKGTTVQKLLEELLRKALK